LQTTTIPCSTLKQPQNWLYVPDLCSKFVTGCFPQQIVVRPTDADLSAIQAAIPLNDIDGQVAILSKYSTLSIFASSGAVLNFQLAPFASSFCTNYNSSGTVTDDTCVNRTGIIDALVFPSLF
jgi:hypothetical protein